MKRKIGFLIALVAMLSMLLVPAAVSAGNSVALAGGVFDKVLMLENKTPLTTSPWPIISADGIGGTLGYNVAGPMFVWGLEAEGLVDGTYALIYYADKLNRFTYWGGDNPGAVISSTIECVGGVVFASGSIDLGMDLPSPPDANQFVNDYSKTLLAGGTGDMYVNAHGAKIWLVPVEALSGGVLPVTAWPPTDNWLFETDLIWYDDTDDPDLAIISITVTPGTIDFGVLTKGATGNGGDINVTNSGNVPIDVSVQSITTGIFSHLQLATVPHASYTVNLPYLAPSEVVPVTLPVPSAYTPVGAETGTLTFIANLGP